MHNVSFLVLKSEKESCKLLQYQLATWADYTNILKIYIRDGVVIKISCTLAFIHDFPLPYEQMV